jgi:uncharacterized protein YydD (DUF2326 family)
MPNITISIEESLLKKGREYARKQGISFNALIRKLLRDNVENSNERFAESFKLTDQAKGNSKGEKWIRNELYER